ncbi:MAG: hypothetical protein ABSF57_08075 [Acidobacteriaceae bacterium]|jgi:hypothetical protein
MSAIPSSYADFKPRASASNIELGKPVASVSDPRQIPQRQLPIHPPAPRLSVLCALSREPEDARITGGTRSLDRRLLALNLSISRSAAVPAQN